MARPQQRIDYTPCDQDEQVANNKSSSSNGSKSLFNCFTTNTTLVVVIFFMIGIGVGLIAGITIGLLYQADQSVVKERAQLSIKQQAEREQDAKDRCSAEEQLKSILQTNEKYEQASSKLLQEIARLIKSDPSCAQLQQSMQVIIDKEKLLTEHAKNLSSMENQVMRQTIDRLEQEKDECKKESVQLKQSKKIEFKELEQQKESMQKEKDDLKRENVQLQTSVKNNKCETTVWLKDVQTTNTAKVSA